MVKFNKKTLCAALVVPMLFQWGLTSCSSQETSEGSGRKTPESSPETAEPGVGIGRDMSVVYEDKTFTICIDPGHGFMDSGTGEGYFENGIVEKDINLQIANKLNEDLTAYGFDTVMTHDGVTFPTTSADDGNEKFKPEERVSYANSLDIDYYVSIHVNSFEQDPSISGIRIYYEQNSNKVDTYSESVAREIANALYSEMPDAPEPILADQTVVSYQVVRETKAAASLIEVGFCTNETDAANMVDDEWQSRVAQAIADGLLNFYNNEYLKGDEVNA